MSEEIDKIEAVGPAPERDSKDVHSFLVSMPDVPNVYESVVVAAQRARQVNLANRILPPEGAVKPVEKALSEALAGTVKYEVKDKDRVKPA